MSALPRADVAPGPLRALNDALHNLHHRAGWPSLRTLARETGVSHTTVSKAFSRPALPTWGTVELLVEAMDGDTAHFHDLWLAASAPVDGAKPPPRIAGRRSELDVVRRHLESGTGLLLVTGEAGIGKTTVVTHAATQVGRFVTVAHCRPLSGQVSFLPVADLLRNTLETDAGAWFSAALDTCPRFVPRALAALLPELDEPPEPSPAAFADKLLLAVRSALAALDAKRPIAALVEDLPWADDSTLDVLEFLLDRGVPFPIVATWRTGEPDTNDRHEDWRVRMTASAKVLPIAPLTERDTALQMSLLTGRPPEPGAVDRIYRRSQGHPLFTEQLTVHEATPVDGLPTRLAELIGRRLDRLPRETWATVLALGVADRPLTPDQLGRVIDDPAALTDQVRALKAHFLLSDDPSHGVHLRHPLIGEVVRGRIVPGEAPQVHERIATVLSELLDPPAAEIAAHWRGSGNAAHELVWRIAAARFAEDHYARSQAHEQWLRVIELCREGWELPDGSELTPDLVYAHAVDDGLLVADPSSLMALLDEALLLDHPPLGRAALLRRAGLVASMLGEIDTSLERYGQALELHDHLGPSGEQAFALQGRAFELLDCGMRTQADADIREALRLTQMLDDPVRHRSVLRVAALTSAELGNVEEARRLVAQAWSTPIDPEDPVGDVFLATDSTDVLLTVGARVDEVDAAASRGFEAAAHWQLDSLVTGTLRYNVALAHLRSGDTSGAEELVAVLRDRPLTYAMVNGHMAVGLVDVRRGRLDEVLARLDAVDALALPTTPTRLEDQILRAEVELWLGRPASAASSLASTMDVVLTSHASRAGASQLACLARAEADALEAQGASVDRQAVVARLRSLATSHTDDPFGPSSIGADVGAHHAQWHAELARIEGTAAEVTWTSAAVLWDKLSRPHDAAYCQWRAAQVALQAGHGTAAARLLKKAASNAREHVPLSQAIAATAAGTR